MILTETLCSFLYTLVVTNLQAGSVTMQAQREAPPDMQCNDKFLVQCVAAPPGATVKDISPDMVRVIRVWRFFLWIICSFFDTVRS